MACMMQLPQQPTQWDQSYALRTADTLGRINRAGQHHVGQPFDILRLLALHLAFGHQKAAVELCCVTAETIHASIPSG